MKDCRQFYIDGKWVAPAQAHDFQVINPATEKPIAITSLGTPLTLTKRYKQPRELSNRTRRRRSTSACHSCGELLKFMSQE